MAKQLLETTINYSGGRLANLTKADKTAQGTTDDKEPENPSQVEMIGGASTDARQAANILFTSKLRLPAELLAAGDFYDTTQGATRVNDIYAMTREDYYKQAASEVDTRKNQIKVKQDIVSKCLRFVEEPKKIYEEMNLA